MAYTYDITLTGYGFVSTSNTSSVLAGYSTSDNLWAGRGNSDTTKRYATALFMPTEYINAVAKLYASDPSAFTAASLVLKWTAFDSSGGLNPRFGNKLNLQTDDCEIESEHHMSTSIATSSKSWTINWLSNVGVPYTGAVVVGGSSNYNRTIKDITGTMSLTTSVELPFSEGLNGSIFVSGAAHGISSAKIFIDGSAKDVSAIKVCVGGEWK